MYTAALTSRRPLTDVEFVGLEMSMICKDLGVLPGPGGIFDQDIVHMRWLRAGLSAIRNAEEKARLDEERNRKTRKP